MLQNNRCDVITNELIDALVTAVPVALVDPFDEGLFFYYGVLAEADVVEAQQRLMDAHLNLPIDQRFTLTLSSVNASAFATLAMISIVNGLRAEGRRVNVHGVGVIMDGGLAIAQSADYRSLEATAFVMLAAPTHAAHMDEMSDRWRSWIFEQYESRTGIPQETYRRRTDAGLFLTALQSVEERLFDAIGPAPMRSPRRKVPIVRGSP